MAGFISFHSATLIDKACLVAFLPSQADGDALKLSGYATLFRPAEAERGIESDSRNAPESVVPYLFCRTMSDKRNLPFMTPRI